ncbi:MAG: hypothetical protein JNL02_02155 [Saprospiraceae bacterium]|nr:hypothetical protein [Saprospiraceae bacterium]
MKSIFVSLTICLCFALSAQAQTIQELEADAYGTSGPPRLDKMLLVANAYLAAGETDKALEWAENTIDLAKRLRRPEQRAAALNIQGKAILRANKRNVRDKAAPKFRQSSEILRDNGISNRTLMLDNLENLRILAVKAGRNSELADIDAQIEKLKAGVPPAKTPGGIAAPGAPTPPGATPKANEREQKLLEESKELQAQLAAKEAAISEMSEAQMKNELLLLEQRQMLDSLSYRGKLDSMSLSNWNLVLREADSNRRFNYAIMGILLLIAGGAAYGFIRARHNARLMAEKNNIIREEQQRSENLLLNVLPALVADELKKMGRTNARYFDDVSVLFADFVGFSKIAEQLSPQQLVTELDTCFQAFDDIIARHGLEKIKTIGDAYMVAGGIPDGGGSDLRNMIDAARSMQSWLSEWNANRQEKGLPRYDARIGIHRGPVVAGVVGSRKFAFDIWGDTVNIAARIEQAGEGGRINISGEAYEVVKNYVKCKYRGKIPAKNKGEIDMYFIEN